MVWMLVVLIGVVAGLRTMMAPAVASWGAFAGWLAVDGTWLTFLTSPWSVAILTVLAIGELVADKLPSTPSRTSPFGLGARLVSGALVGLAFTAGSGLAAMIVGGLLGAAGALIGTFLGYEGRTRTARRLGRDFPVALAEDVIAITAGLLLVCVA